MTKVPVALSAQTHPSAAKRALAAFVLLLAAMSTAINAVPIFAKMWKPQLAVVRQATENLAVTEGNKADFDARRQAAKEAADACGPVHKETQEARRAAGAAKCAADKKTLAKLNPKKTDDAFRNAQASLRTARQASTLHWIYGSATGAEVSGITDKQLAPVMIGAVGLPALLVALISALLSLLAVEAIARPKLPAPVETPAGREEAEAPARAAQEAEPESVVVEIPDEAASHFLAPLPEKPAPKPEGPALVPRPRGRPRNPQPSETKDNPPAPAARPRGRPRNPQPSDTKANGHAG